MPRGTVGFAIIVMSTMLASLSAYYMGGAELVVFMWSALVLFSVAAGAAIGAAIDLSVEKYFIIEEDADAEIQTEIE